VPASIEKQCAAMDSLAWRITYEWNQAKNNLKTMAQMQTVWQDTLQTGHYQCLAEKRKESVYYLWSHTRQRTLAENQIHGRWLNGKFFANWCDLPEKYKYDDSLLKTLPSGHFWLQEGQATKVRYFISEDAKSEDAFHFITP
jgi:hypothetical protein